MRSILLCTYMLIFCATSVAEEPRMCVSPYALTHKNFEYKKYKRHTKDVGPFVTVWLWHTFGTNLENPTKELQRPEVVGTEVAFLNTTCLNNNNCSEYEILHGYTNASFRKAVLSGDERLRQKLVRQSDKLASFLLSHLRVDQSCKINTFLEGKQSREVFTIVTEWIAPSFQGRCDFVWNPQGGRPGRPAPPASISEGHGASPVFREGDRCIANPDGTTIPDADYPAFLAHYGAKCEYACFWGPNMNCRSSDGPTNTHPRARSCSDTSDFRKARKALRRAKRARSGFPGEWTEADNKSLTKCDFIHPTNDGERKGFLSKMSDEAHYFAWTVLFPAMCDNNRRNCKNFLKMGSLKEGKPFWSWFSPYLYTEDGSMRPVWRANHRPDKAPKNVVVWGRDDQGKRHCWKISNPAIRND